jgi:hypothetical protein
VELDDTARRYSAALFGLEIVKQLEAEGANAPTIPEYDAFLSH